MNTTTQQLKAQIIEIGYMDALERACELFSQIPSATRELNREQVDKIVANAISAKVEGLEDVKKQVNYIKEESGTIAQAFDGKYEAHKYMNNLEERAAFKEISYARIVERLGYEYIDSYTVSKANRGKFKSYAHEFKAYESKFLTSPIFIGEEMYSRENLCQAIVLIRFLLWGKNKPAMQEARVEEISDLVSYLTGKTPGIKNKPGKLVKHVIYIVRAQKAVWAAGKQMEDAACKALKAKAGSNYENRRKDIDFRIKGGKTGETFSVSFKTGRTGTPSGLKNHMSRSRGKTFDADYFCAPYAEGLTSFPLNPKAHDFVFWKKSDIINGKNPRPYLIHEL